MAEEIKIDDLDDKEKIKLLERDIRKLNREVSHLKNAISQEKTAYTTVLNQQKASTFIQRERERYLALLLANSPSIILFLSQTGRIEFCTDYFVTKAGFSTASDILGRALMETLTPFLDETAAKNLADYSHKVIETNTPFSFEMTFNFNANHPEEYFAGLIVPMRDDEQNSNGIMIMFHDITDLKKSREDALAASNAKSSFLSNMSHEIRTPMSAIIGMTSIGKKEKTVERKDYAFEKIESASTHLLGVINDILDISKIESGKMELSLIEFSFSRLVDRVGNVVIAKMREKQQSFAIEIDPSIPDKLFGDDQRLAQVITNILSNANKFTPEYGTITMTAKRLDMFDDKCKIELSVRDSGIGMTPQEKSKLFNTFQQANAGTSRKYGGSGLGLAISKRILEMMDGTISVDSIPGEGSCFSIVVPLGIIRENPADTANTALEDNNSDEDFAKYAILVVDDIDINLEIAVALLEPTNITVDTANSGREAVEKFMLNPKKYDLIFMDMQMPEIDGLEATRMIRASNLIEAARIPIIAMTANVFKEDIEKCLAAGMNSHLGKPIDMNELIGKLKKYLR